MINIPLTDIKAKIKEQSSLSEDDINNKIKEKLDELSGLISEEGAAHIIANELGIKIFAPSAPGEKLQVKNVLAGMRNIEINGKITRKYELKEFQTEKRSGKLASFMIADETGFIRVVLWNDQTDNFEKLEEGDIVTLQGGYVRDNNGRKEIHLSNNGKIDINPAGVSVEAVDDTPTRKKLSELQEGDQNVEVLATIVQVFDIRFFEVDPETGRRAIEKDGKFYAGDKEVTTIDYAYVMNMFLDDGTENIRTVLWKNQIQNLLGLDHEAVLKFRETPSDFEPTKTELLGTIIKIVGRTNKNEAFNRLELIANMIYKDVDPEKEIKKLEQETPATATEQTTEKTEHTEEKHTESEENSSEVRQKAEQTEVPSEVQKKAEQTTEKPVEILAEPEQSKDSDSQSKIETSEVKSETEQPKEEPVEEQPIAEDTSAVEEAVMGAEEDNTKPPDSETVEKKKDEHLGIKEETLSIEDLEDLDK